MSVIQDEMLVPLTFLKPVWRITRSRITSNGLDENSGNQTKTKQTKSIAPERLTGPDESYRIDDGSPLRQKTGLWFLDRVHTFRHPSRFIFSFR